MSDSATGSLGVVSPWCSRSCRVGGPKKRTVVFVACDNEVNIYGLYLYNEGQVRIWNYERANGEHTMDVLNRLRAEFPNRDIKMIWDGASYHRSAIVRERAASLNIECLPLPAYSPDFMPVESLWHWLREDVTYNYCHDTHNELIVNVEKFQNRINLDPYAIADRLWVKADLKGNEEKLRFSK